MSQINLVESCEALGSQRMCLLRWVSLHRKSVTLMTALIPVAVLAILIARYSITAPVADEWNESAVLKGFSHFPTPQILFSQHSEHRLAVTRLIVFLTTAISGGDLRSAMAVTFAAAIFTSMMAMILLRRTLGGDQPWQFWWLAIHFLILSPVQYFNWISAFQSLCIVPIACLMAGLVVIEVLPGGWRRTLLCMFFSLVAAFCLTSGLMVAVLLPLAALTHPGRRIAVRFTAYALFAVALFLVYFHGWKRPNFGADPGWCIAHPVAVGQYILAFLGSCVCRGMGTSLSMVAGAVVLVVWLGQLCFVAIHRENRDLLRKATPWILLGMFAFASACMAATGRARLGASQAQASRYTTTSVQLWVSAIAVWPILYAALPARRPHRRSSPLWAVAVAGLLISFFIAQVVSIFQLRREWALRLRGQAGLELMNYPNSDALLTAIDRNIAEVRPAAIELNDLNRLHPPIVPTNRFDSITTATVAIGTFEPSVTQPDGSIQVRGVAALPNGRPADCVVITCDSGEKVPTVIWMTQVAITKPEVADSGGPQASPGCWKATIPAGQIPPGTNLSAWAFDAIHQAAYPLNGPRAQGG
jgi:hypothetical protein